MPRKITEIIKAVCKEHGISYTSKHDAKRLGELIIELRSIADEIDCILNRHDVKSDIRIEINWSLARLGALNHELMYLAKEIKND